MLRRPVALTSTAWSTCCRLQFSFRICGGRDGRDRGRDYDRDRGRDHRDRDGGRDRDRDRGGRRSERDEEAPIDPEKEAQLLAALEQDSSDEEVKKHPRYLQ